MLTIDGLTSILIIFFCYAVAKYEAFVVDVRDFNQQFIEMFIVDGSKLYNDSFIHLLYSLPLDNHF